MLQRRFFRAKSLFLGLWSQENNLTCKATRRRNGKRRRRSNRNAGKRRIRRRSRRTRRKMRRRKMMARRSRMGEDEYNACMNRKV